MEEIGDGSHEDVARAFFRYHVGEIGRLVKKVSDTVSALAKSSIGNVQTLLPEANRIVVVRLLSSVSLFSQHLINLAGCPEISVPISGVQYSCLRYCASYDQGLDKQAKHHRCCFIFV